MANFPFRTWQKGLNTESRKSFDIAEKHLLCGLHTAGDFRSNTMSTHVDSAPQLMFISENLYVRKGKDRVISRVSTLDPNCIVFESIVYEDCRLHVFNAFSSGWVISRALICDLTRNVQEGRQPYFVYVSLVMWPRCGQGNQRA